MVAAIMFFFLDLVAFIFFEGWYVHALLAYFFLQLLEGSDEFWYVARLAGILLLLLVQDSLRFAHFGLSLSYLIPLALLAWYGRQIVLYAPWSLIHLLVPCAVLADSLFLHPKSVLSNGIFYLSIQKIFITLMVGYMILLGTRGSRFLAHIWAKKRKVWTPYR